MTAPSTLPLLMEIGCEEIPARFLAQAQKDFGDRLKATLEESRLIPKEEKLIALSPGEMDGAPGTALAVVSRRKGAPSTGGEGAHQDLAQLQAYSTPRRLVVYVPAILERQPDKTEEITGPPVKVALDGHGKYTRAAESFAQKNSADVADLIRIKTPKGEHLGVKKTTLGRPALEVLSEVLPRVITGLSFPKSMYWTGKSGTRFIRPIRWILALLGEGKHAGVIPFEIAGVKAGDFTFGHRAAGQNPIRVTSFKEYVQKLNQSQVELEPEKRRERVQSECKALLEVSGLRVVEDKTLEDWIVNSTEWPHGLLGGFEDRFLKLPREILVTVMRDHQKYFAVEDVKGALHPSFVTLLNVPGDPKKLIRRGHERVLTARFSDAEFFWKADQKIPLRDRLPMLEKVTYQAKLGTYADKVRRMEAIAKEICQTLEGQSKMTAAETASALRAVQLCKCDLTTQMVQEFTELQGIVGGLYAKAQGVPQPVSEAIYDHYLPQGAEDKCPRSLVGAVVSLADKIDSVTAGFSVGLEPTGSSDPFGLRRSGNGIIKLAAEVLPDVDLDVIAGNAVRRVEQTVRVGRNNTALVFSFLQERLGFYLREVTGLRHDIVKAVLRVVEPGFVPSRALKRALAFQEVRSSDDFLALAHAAKRTRNILEKSATAGDFGASLEVDEGLLQPGPERALYDAFVKLRGSLNDYEKLGDYDAALRTLATLRQPVDIFFDKVLVMDHDPQVRGNRLRLLANLDGEVFSKFGDLSQIESPTSTSVDASTDGKSVASGE
jgi:glycyl-tRNA synthetase beta chain